MQTETSFQRSASASRTYAHVRLTPTTFSSGCQHRGHFQHADPCPTGLGLGFNTRSGTATLHEVCTASAIETEQKPDGKSGKLPSLNHDGVQHKTAAFHPGFLHIFQGVKSAFIFSAINYVATTGISRTQDLKLAEAASSLHFKKANAPSSKPECVFIKPHLEMKIQVNQKVLEFNRDVHFLLIC